MTDIYPDGPFLFEGADARAAWRQIMPTLIVGKMKGEQGVIWKGHIWTADDGSRLVQVRGYH